MKRFSPTLLDLIVDHSPQESVDASRIRLTIEQVREGVARDLEALLNSRLTSLDISEADSFKEVSNSVLQFGIRDFVSKSLASAHDRQFICRSIERAVISQERRLRSVKVEILPNRDSTNSVVFSIQALLVVKPSAEPVSFDAVLQPTTHKYSVGQARR